MYNITISCVCMQHVSLHTYIHTYTSMITILTVSFSSISFPFSLFLSLSLAPFLYRSFRLVIEVCPSMKETRNRYTTKTPLYNGVKEWKRKIEEKKKSFFFHSYSCFAFTHVILRQIQRYNSTTIL